MTAMDGRRPMFANIDDYLGDGATRFFGAGYRRAEYQIRDVIVSPARHEATDPAGRADRPAVRASVTVRYPRDWSTKAENIDLRPHLSSIDTLLLGVQLGEAYLAHALGADEDVRARARLRRVTLQAGTEPQEDLTDLPAVAVLSRSETVQEEPDLVRSVFDCRIGAMRSRCEIEHERLEPPGGTARPDAGAYPTIDDVLGPPDTRYYGDGFRFRRLLIEDIRADLDALTADATVRTERVDGAPAARRGLEGRYQPCVSMVDCFVVNLQLAQVLMYEMDSIRRRDSNTLWMLNTVLTAERPSPLTSAPLSAHAAVGRNTLLPLRGGMWRNVELNGEYGGVAMRCSLAHELPAGSLASAR